MFYEMSNERIDNVIRMIERLVRRSRLFRRGRADTEVCVYLLYGYDKCSCIKHVPYRERTHDIPCIAIDWFRYDVNTLSDPNLRAINFIVDTYCTGMYGYIGVNLLL